nr:unnamed protein product [Spirometra erinaceieuropaei]
MTHLVDPSGGSTAPALLFGNKLKRFYAVVLNPFPVPAGWQVWAVDWCMEEGRKINDDDDEEEEEEEEGEEEEEEEEESRPMSTIALKAPILFDTD